MVFNDMIGTVTYVNTVNETPIVSYTVRVSEEDLYARYKEEERKALEEAHRIGIYNSRKALGLIPEPKPPQINIRPVSKAIRWQQLSQRTR